MKHRYLALTLAFLWAVWIPWPFAVEASADYPVTLGVQGEPALDEAGAAEPLHAAPAAQLYRKGKLTLTLDAVTYLPGQSATITLTLQNESTAAATLCVAGLALDGLVFPVSAEGPVEAKPGESVTLAAATPAVSKTLLALTGKAAPKELSVEYLLTTGTKTLQVFSDPVALFDSDGLSDAFAPETAPIFDDNHLQVYTLAFYPAYGKALLLLEATRGAAWESVTVDAVYDGCRGLLPQSFRLEPGMKAACLLSVAADCPWLGRSAVDGIQLYLTFRHGDKQREPYTFALGAPSAAACAPAPSAPLWSADGCAVRFLGVSEGFFADGDGLVFQVENGTEQPVYLLCANRYAYLDGQRVSMSEYGATCCPGAVSRVIIAPEGSAALRLTGIGEINLRLSLYRQEGWYLREFARSPSLALALQPMPNE